MGQNLSALGQDLRVAKSPEKNLWGIITPPENEAIITPRTCLMPGEAVDVENAAFIQPSYC